MSNPWENDYAGEKLDAITMAAPNTGPGKFKPWDKEYIDEYTWRLPGGGVGGKVKQPTLEPSRLVFMDLRSMGYRPEVVAGLMGNIDVETGGSFSHQQKQVRGPAKGLFQFDPTGPFPKAYEEFLSQRGVEDSNLAQVEFVHETIYGDLQDIIGRGNAEKLRQVFEEGSAEEVARSFMKIWERPGKPHWNRRKAATMKWLEKSKEWEDRPFSMYGPQVDKLASLREGRQLTDQQKESVKGTTEMVASLSPVSGEIMSARDSIASFKEGDYASGVISGLGAIPMVGSIARGVKALGYIPDKYIKKSFNSKTKEAGTFNNPVHLKDGSRISGFNSPDGEYLYGYDKNGEVFTIRAEFINPEDVISSKDSNKTSEWFKGKLK